VAEWQTRQSQKLLRGDPRVGSTPTFGTRTQSQADAPQFPFSLRYNRIKYMDIFIIVLESVLVFLGIGLIGFWITRRGIIPENVLSLLSRLAIDIALPCMVFASITVNFSPEELPDWWQLPLWWFVFAAVSLVLTLITMFISRKETRSEFALNLFFQNGLFMPLIIISGIFGTDAIYIPQLYIFIMLHPVLFFSAYQLFFKNKSQTRIQWIRVFNPILIATVLAVVVQLANARNFLPDFVQSILQILGGMALPLILIILGGSLYLDIKQKGKFYYGEIIKFVIIKNLVFPLAFLGLLILARQDYSLALIFFLEASVPPITGTPIVTERAGGNKSISNQFVLSSFAFSIVSIPVVFLIFNHYFPMPG
jgi:predicted permease